MADMARTKKRRDRPPRGVARYGDASGDRKRATRAGGREGDGFSFSSEGLALIGLRRRLAAGGKRVIG